ncbi:rSAM-partnered protein (plasmid) [Halarchaeum sp. CBA1220]|uniref:Htur_1727 family rSAM-partnered candidate RiPP n=1 Tax=Halarchaeum sp. CBA1220 TaxID=1853682 RepID=UPI000F3A9F75|nr:Htur_1727 family rSAM-partnered candidate RiPP [Halarchaeum sp. CBA1220]QLC35339.1 rSAM-partnered protein [Halarchaeum sp. CBA1220]
MDETDRRRIDARSRSATSGEWEVFVRETTEAALQHVGSVTAPNADVAHEQATRLFGAELADVWVAPATAVTRFVADGVETEAGTEGGAPAAGVEES